MSRNSDSSAQHWTDVLERQASSGLSAAAFIRQESISAATFSYWKRRLRLMSDNSPAPASSGGFLPVRIESGEPDGPPGPVRIYIPRGIGVELPDGPAHLGAALRAMREAERC